MFRYETTVKVHNMDAAQRLFFAEQFVMAHEAWEACLSSVGFSIGRILSEDSFMVPVVHAEADYSAPVALSDSITVEVRCDRIGTKSFTMGYAISKNDHQPIGRVTLIHATVSQATGRAIPIPDEFLDVLNRITQAE